MSGYYALPGILYSIPRSPITALGLPFVFGLVSGSMTAKTVKGRWYESLAVPPGRPPRQAFPIVWSLLYLSMGYASHLAVRAYDSSVSPSTRSDLSLGLALYYGQLGLNFAWSSIFFGQKNVGLALVDSFLLAGTTFYMTKTLNGPTDSRATWFLLPYCAWLSYATYLNGGIWLLNRNRRLSKED